VLHYKYLELGYVFLGTSNQRVWALITGIFFSGIVNPILEIITPVFVSVWFGNHERARALCFVWSFGTLIPSGIISSLYANDVVFQEQYNIIFLYILVTAVYVSIIGILNLCLQQEGPPVPPSIAADTQKIVNVSSVLYLFKSFPFIICLLAWALFAGSYKILVMEPSLIFSLSIYNDSSDNKNSELGNRFLSIALLCGFISSYIFSYIIDTYRNYKLMIIVCTFGSTICLLGVALWITLFYHTLDSGVLAIAMIYGIFSVPTYPIVMDLGLELSFPVTEEVTIAMLTVVTYITAIIIHYLIDWEIGLTNSTAIVFTLSIASGISTILYFIMKPEYKRLFFEREPRKRQKL